MKKSLYKTWLLALLALTLPQIAVAYQIPTTPNGLWTGTGTTAPASKDTPSTLRTTVTVAGSGMTMGARNNTTLMRQNNTTVPLLPTDTNGIQVLATANSSCNNSAVLCSNLGTVKFDFTDAAGNPILVRNPVIHMSRLGGFLSYNSTAYSLGAVLTLTTSGATLQAPTTGSRGFRIIGNNQISPDLASFPATPLSGTGIGDCTAAPNAPQAGCGSIPVTGTVSSLSFNVDLLRSNTSGNWQSAISPFSWAADGIYFTVSVDEDYGDAPASFDPTTAASHIISNLALGTSVDADNSTIINGGATGLTSVTPSPNAVGAGSDNNGANGDGADENGVVFPTLTTAQAGSNYTVPISLSGASRAGQSCGWIDFNKNGTFDSATERACASFISGATSANLTWTVPAGITAGNTYARIRASYDTAGVQNPTGRLNSGEVEDYQLAIASAPGTISGSLYQDANNDNTLTAGETKLPANVDVELLNSVGTVIATVQTNATGDYTFTNVPVATGYQVRVVTSDLQIPTEYAIKTTNPITGINVTAGTTVANQNFGFITLPLSFGSCGNNPFISYNLPNTLSTLNVNTLTLDTVGSSTIPYNAIGYNIVNNLIYGIQRPPTATTTNSNNLVVVGSNGVPVSLGAVTNLPLTEFYNAGDVGSNNIYYVVNGLVATKTFYRIDLNPASSTYRQIISTFSLPVPYNTTAYSFGDIAFNPVDGQIYAVLNTVVSNVITAQQLAKIDPSSGSVTLLGIATLTDIDSFIGLFVDRTGYIYGYQGIAGKLWRYNSTTGTRVLMKDSLPTANSNADGARCYDSTPISSSSERPQLLLVKRITAINGVDVNGFQNGVDNPMTDPNYVGTKALEDNDPLWPSPNTTSLRGAIHSSTIAPTVSFKPGDEIEYTIYFLNNGNAQANNVSICDFVPAKQTYVGTGYNSVSLSADTGGFAGSSYGIVLQSANGAAPLRATNATDGDRGQFYTSGFPNSCIGTNSGKGAVVVNIGNVPNATSSGAPANSYGFIRFKAKID